MKLMRQGSRPKYDFAGLGIDTWSPTKNAGAALLDHERLRHQG